MMAHDERKLCRYLYQQAAVVGNGKSFLQCQIGKRPPVGSVFAEFNR